MIDRIKDWYHLRHKKAERLRRVGARSALRKISSIHRRRLRRIREDVHSQYREISEREMELAAREEKIRIREDRVEQMTEELDYMIAKIRAGMTEWDSTLDFFRNNMGRVFGGFDRLKDTINVIQDVRSNPSTKNRRRLHLL